MRSFQFYIDQMDQLLSELIQIANRLYEMSKQIISEEEIVFLQKKQEELLIQIESIDQEIQQHHPYQMTRALEENIHHQLQLFQQLNREFIQHIESTRGLIQFELYRLEDQEGKDFSRIKRLKKVTSSPDGSKTINSKKNKES